MDKELAAFLKTGLDRYPMAVDIIEQFRKSTQDELERMLRKRLATFKGAVHISEDNLYRKAKGDPGYGKWISCRFTGEPATGKPTITFEMGIWWEPPKSEKPVIFYAGLYKERDDGVYGKAAIKDKRVFSYDRWLCIEPDCERDMEQDFNELLDEVEYQSNKAV